MAAIQSLNELMADWNSNQIDWIVALQDSTVTYEEFLRVQQDVLVRQSLLVAEFGFVIDGVSLEFQPAFEPLVIHMYRRMDLLEALFGAAATGTDQQFNVALARYQDHTTSDAFDALEALFTSPEIDALLTSQGVDGDKLLESFRRILGE